MLKLGYKLMSEEHGPTELVRNAQRAEQVGFEFAAISDHFYPWIEEQGHSPLAWSVLGAIANATQRLGLMTAVTCPTMRYHPANCAGSRDPRASQRRPLHAWTGVGGTAQRTYHRRRVAGVGGTAGTLL